MGPLICYQTRRGQLGNHMQVNNEMESSVLCTYLCRHIHSMCVSNNQRKRSYLGLEKSQGGYMGRARENGKGKSDVIIF